MDYFELKSVTDVLFYDKVLTNVVENIILYLSLHINNVAGSYQRVGGYGHGTASLPAG